MFDLKADLFAVSKTSKVLCQEVSTLSSFFGDCVPMNFFLTTKRGNRLLFVFDRTERDPDGDVLAWFFRPSDGALKLCPAVTDWSIELFND